MARKRTQPQTDPIEPVIAAYIAWLVVPLKERRPATQDELAEQLDVDPTVLRVLRRDPEFIKRLGAAMHDALYDLLPDLIGRYMEGAASTPAAQARQFFEQLGLMPRTGEESGPKVILGVDPKDL